MLAAMKAPIHALGVSAILAYGWLYYAFAKTGSPLAVQLDPGRSRQAISYLTFYGGVASSLVWLGSGWILSWGDLSTLLITASAMMGMASVYFGWHIDARKTGLAAFILNPIALALTLFGDTIWVGVLSMMLFGIANGV